MNKFPTFTRAAAALVIATAIPSFAADPELTRIVQDTSSVLDIVDLAESDGAVRGRLLNRSNSTIKDIRLSVSHSFLWKNDHNPGPDDPSRATIVTLEQSVPPRGSIAFVVPTGPLPSRADGRFTTETQVLSFVAWSTVGGVEIPASSRPSADL
jgi:hypothetical protein